MVGTRPPRAAGQLCGVAETTDIVDASVAIVAQHLGLRVITSDAVDLRRLDNRLELVAI